eukprot:3599581-Pyramimonas_sp.AAC.1
MRMKQGGGGGGGEGERDEVARKRIIPWHATLRRAACRNSAGRLRTATMHGRRGCQDLPREKARRRLQTARPAS